MYYYIQSQLDSLCNFQSEKLEKIAQLTVKNKKQNINWHSWIPYVACFS